MYFHIQKGGVPLLYPTFSDPQVTTRRRYAHECKTPWVPNASWRHFAPPPFPGHDIAPDEDVPMWATVHCLTYYCAAQSIASRIMHNRDMQIASGSHHINDADAKALKGTAEKCAKCLPVLEAIKENGWNVLLAESVDPKGSYAHHRDARLQCLREWASWVNNPYDEQRGASRVPEERRGKCYTFTNQGEDEFPTPPRARWPQWTIPGYLSYYEQKYGARKSTTYQKRGFRKLHSLKLTLRP